MHESSPKCYNMHITCTRGLPNDITCMMHNIITYTRVLPNVVICIMHNIICRRALLNVISSMMHDITCTRAVPNDIQCRRTSQVYLGMCKLTQTCAVVLLYSLCVGGG